MSLLDRLRPGHLSDVTLARLWTDGLEAGGPTHPHLDACAACRARVAALDQWVGDIADTVRDEADQLLTPERLAAQQAQIARRLEAVDRPARVLAFPKAARAVLNGHSHVRRWVTVAAAACLIAGFGLGQVFPVRQAMRTQQDVEPGHLSLPSTRIIVKQLTPEVTPFNDEEVLSADAFSRSHVATLSALDDMTPHARDTVLNRRNKKQ